MFNAILTVIIAIIIAPVIGGLLSGIDRILTARMQGRVGPPLLQPFYDFFKLLGKENIVVNRVQMFYVLSNLALMITSVVLFVLKQDLLMIVFVMAFGSMALILGGLSVQSPYSRMGSHREMLQMLAYEPILIFMVVGIYLMTKSFNVQGVLNLKEPLLIHMPLIFMAILLILTIKMRKSPFDFSTSHHGHQELVKGLLTEYAGPQLALIELAHWYELVLVLGFIVLFWVTNIYIGIAIAFGSMVLEIIIDNITARMTWKWMLAVTWTVGIGLCLINIALLYR
ncbi:MAG: respiratory chain complex I subunit 1 family protein [Deltaproteobacteria bacterium]